MPSTQAVIDRLNLELEKIGNTKTQASIAQEIGITPALLSTYKKGKYDTDNQTDLEKKITAWLDNQDLRRHIHPLRPTFVVTRTSSCIFELATTCRSYQEIGVCVGPAGVGKTTAITEYARLNGNCILLFANQSMTKRTCLARLAEGLKLESRGSAANLFERIASKLHEGDYFVIIDEAEHLSVQMLDDLRRLSDPEVGGCGMLFIGLPRFLESVKTDRRDYAYLLSRIRHHYKAHELDERGAEAIVHSVLPNSNGLWRKLYAKTANARMLVNLINQVYRLHAIPGNDGIPMQDLIDEAWTDLRF